MDAKRRRYPIGVALLAPLIPLAAACGGDSKVDGGGTGPVLPFASRVEITSSDPVIPEGGTMTLSARVLDQSGAPMPGAVVVWSSEDPSTATVDASTGLLQGLSGGEVEIVATSGGLRDEVEALVYYAVFEDQARMRLRAEGERSFDLREGEAYFLDRLGTETGDFSGVLFVDEGWSTMLYIFVTGRVAGGEQELTSVDPVAFWEADFSAFSSPFAVLVTDATDEGGTFYVSQSGWVSGERVEFPQGPGDRSGQFRGRMMTAMHGFSIAFTPSDDMVITPLGTSSTLYVDLWSELYHRARPSVSLQLVGGPHEGPAHSDDGYSTARHFSLDLISDPDLDVVGLLEVQSDEGFSVGSWSLAAKDIQDPLSEPTRRAMIYYYEEALAWVNEAGELRIDLAQPPTAPDLTGELRGSIAAGFIGPGSTPGEPSRVQLTGTFHVPWRASAYEAALPVASRDDRWTSAMRRWGWRGESTGPTRR
jgi:hypothetical protein